MICPSCKTKFSNLRGLALAREQRIKGYVCPFCGAALKNRALPKSSCYRMTVLVLVGFVLAIPADVLWTLNVYIGGAYLLAVIAGSSCAMYLWVVPKDFRQQPLELIQK